MRCIYIIRNLINHKVYIGQTKNFLRRKAGHLYAARKGGLCLIHCAFRKHGIENFIFELLEECEDEHVDEYEKFWIAHYESTNRDKGYNIQSGGHGMYVTKSLTIEKLSEALKRRWAEGRMPSPRGRKLSDEAKKRIGTARQDSYHNDETKRKIGIANQGEKHPSFGKVWIHNLEQQRRVSKEEIDVWLAAGWYQGRK